ncbi:uncharacterized protein LOC120631007 [Pararge aegeria]|uniref:Jg2283 protein n=1 Tax=Pararge aegeria aegeria TaxID=348720 RepID=A0A8S4RRA7_9NEOP|nr:uncharacterized protein LOC120631007 [Pararge aegeria]CAH2240271.1 jg2283 [Pararge aegeria aegeria]
MELRQNSILRISDGNTMDLIDLYEKEQCLWNTAIEEYKSRPKRCEAAIRIAEKLNIPHFTSRYVIIKFKNLRNSYCQELKKIANSIKAGDCPAYKPKVFWFNKMDSFLRPHLQHQSRDLRYLHSYNTDELSIKSEPQVTEESVHEEVYIDEPNYSSDSEEFYEDELLKKRSRNSSTASKRPRLEESHENDFSHGTRDISSQLPMKNQKEDCYDSFGKYVSALLSNMSVRTALEVQSQIVSLMVSATLNESEGNE